MSQRTELGHPTCPLYCLHVEDAVRTGGLVGLQQPQRYIVDGDTPHRDPIGGAVVGVAVDHKVGTVAVYHFGQARGSEVRENFGSLALYSACDRRIVKEIGRA